MICSDNTVEKVGKIEKVERKEESEEIQGTPVVAIHIRCPSNTGSRECPLESRQEGTRSAAAVSASVEALGNEADDELSSDSSPFLSAEDECDVAHPQEALDKRVKSCLPRNIRNHGLGQQNDDQSDALASVENPVFSSSKNERQLKQESNGGDKARNWAKERPGPSGLHREPNISLSPPRPSQWKRVYSKELKQEEQLADETLKRKPRRLPRKKRVRSQEEELHANKVRLIKKIKNAIKRKAVQEPDSGAAVLPPDETIAQIFGVAVEDCRDSSSNNSSRSCSPASTSTSTANSWDSFISSDEDLEEPTTDRHFREVSESANNRRENGAKTRQHVTVSRRTFTISNGDLQKPNIGRPVIKGVKSTSERFENGQSSVETRRSSTNNLNWDSWDSSTTSDEAFEELNVGQQDTEEKSTSENAVKEQRRGTNSPCSINSWDLSTSSESDGSTNSEAELTLASVSPWESPPTPVGEFQEPSTPGSEKNEARDPRTCSPCDSSNNADEEIEKGTLETANNGQKKGRKTRSWFRFKKNKVAPL